ncbi:helix-turn-helix domain-containing protein [Micromonospora sp. NPDC050187]|uniref:helix-turn-helix domain-containing protein n=1 Tax=Micromonospora sp. NPDC050187 TaxID=3364277 RepID=UPI0037ADF45A
MAEGSIDREAWAKVISTLIAQETGTPAKPEGNKSAFAQLVGVTYKTVLRWTQAKSEVSEDSVRQVARALHVSPLELLVRVGYYTGADLDAAVQASGPVDTVRIDQSDPALRVILESGVPPRVQQRMIQRLQDLRSREAERQVDEVRWWVDQARGA